MKKFVLFIVGPTGSGKSEVGLEIAKRVGGEIVSCDSMLFYRGMDIGTAKPTRAEREKTPHHLIDLMSPKAECSVFEYCGLAARAIDRVLAKGSVPVVVGGSGLYLRAITNGLTPLPGRRPRVRSALEQLWDRRGGAYLYNELARLKPDRAREIHPNDKRRIIRALEIVRASAHGSNGMKRVAEPLSERNIPFFVFGLLRRRDELYRRIEKRVDQMIASGWLEEVKRLKKRKLSKTAAAAIGYRELLQYLNEEGTLEQTIDDIKKRTRHLAKKQMTWFRKENQIVWIHVLGSRFAARTANQILKRTKAAMNDRMRNRVTIRAQ